MGLHQLGQRLDRRGLQRNVGCVVDPNDRNRRSNLVIGYRYYRVVLRD